MAATDSICRPSAVPVLLLPSRIGLPIPLVAAGACVALAVLLRITTNVDLCPVLQLVESVHRNRISRLNSIHLCGGSVRRTDRDGANGGCLVLVDHIDKRPLRIALNRRR